MTILRDHRIAAGPTELPLAPGQRLDRETFHRRYEAMPRNVKAELVGGTVYMPFPVSIDHGAPHSDVVFWLGCYKAATPGTCVLDNATIILDEANEPQPDAALLLNPECGGRTRIVDRYLTDPPELVVEIAMSSADYDIHAKRELYERAGVGEYLVVLAGEGRLVWFRNYEGRFEDLEPGEDGLYRSGIFPASGSTRTPSFAGTPPQSAPQWNAG